MIVVIVVVVVVVVVAVVVVVVAVAVVAVVAVAHSTRVARQTLLDDRAIIRCNTLPGSAPKARVPSVTRIFPVCLSDQVES